MLTNISSGVISIILFEIPELSPRKLWVFLISVFLKLLISPGVLTNVTLLPACTYIHKISYGSIFKVNYQEYNIIGQNLGI